MTQFINPKPVAAMSSMGARPDPYTQGMGGVLSLADGGLARKPYLFGGIKRRLKKLIPKEAAGIMQMAAPFVAPHSMLGAAALSGLGQYKSRGKINPLQLAMSVAPGLQGRHLDKIGMNKAGDFGTNESVIRNLMNRSNIGSALDDKLFGSPRTTHMNEFDEIFKVTEPTSGWIGEGGQYGGLGDLVKKGGEALIMKGPKDAREIDKMALAAIGLAGASYIEAKKQMQLSGEDLEDYGIYNSDDWESIDWSETFKDSSYLPDSFAQGGLARVRHAMGSAQFPPQKRAGLQWGSDKGEGLGGEEVEADMRYTGGFMPYGDKPKADDVPARLSKDEFVFTDEAVAGMGEGDVNVGAERLYNMMKNLEQQGAQNMEGIFNNPLAMS